MTANDHKDLLPFPMPELVDIVQQAGARVREGCGSLGTVVDKLPQGAQPDLATDVDRSVEVWLKTTLADMVPGATFWAEESNQGQPALDQCFVIDPVDGTNNLVNGIPLVAVNVGFVQQGRMVAAATCMPFARETIWAVQGAGTWCDGTQLHLAETKRRMAMMSMAIQPRNWGRIGLDRLFGIARQVRSVRLIGSMATELAWVASNRLQLWVGAGQVWDFWPGILLVQEAGGKVILLDQPGAGSGPERGIRVAGVPSMVDWAVEILGDQGL